MYDGVEYSMLSLGNADCILVSCWNGQTVYRILIDGGNKGDAEKVRSFLHWKNISRLDAVISTHGHDDHSGGLIEILADQTLEIGRLWSHMPGWHVNVNAVNQALREAGPSVEVDAIHKSFETATTLFNIARQRRIPHNEPFEGAQIGSLYVLSPSLQFYEQLVVEFADANKIRAQAATQRRYDQQVALEEILVRAGRPIESSLLDDPQTSPENETSVVVWAKRSNSSLLLTADAGVCALTEVTAKYQDQVRKLFTMQIPHHGSRRNLSKTLIEHFSPTYALVSAVGNPKHPRRAVVRTFKDRGTAVYSTHYPEPNNLRHFIGVVPQQDVGAATPLWDANVLAKRVGA
jgi:beta-lactamase superfamily II metal-dependent hydrolase